MKGRHKKAQQLAALPGGGEVPIIKPTRRIRITPEVGYAIVKLEDRKQTAGGIVIPDQAQEHPRVYLVATSGRYPFNAQMIEHEAKPGDEVCLAPTIKRNELRGRDVVPVVVSAPQLVTHPELPTDHRVTKLSDIIGVIHEERLPVGNA